MLKIVTYTPPLNRQCFFLHGELFEAMKRKEIEATVAAMREYGIYKLPYPVVDIKIAGDSFWRWHMSDAPRALRKAMDTATGRELLLRAIEDETIVCFTNVSLDPSIKAKPFVYRFGKYYSSDEVEDEGSKGNFKLLRDLLIVLLATKNIKKQVHHDAMAKLRIGKSREGHVYTTTLTLPAAADVVRVNATASDGTVRPHLRRGHVRRQRHGPKNVAVKLIWVEPCFINADPDFISEREAYNISKGAHGLPASSVAETKGEPQ